MALQALQFTCLRAFVNTRIYILNSSWLSPDTQPDQWRTYDQRTDLFASRISVPKPTSTDRKLPLIIAVHGGGFILNNPSSDDRLARHLADATNSIVVSIDYRKAPQNKFPAAYKDIVSQSLAVIDDTDLPIDSNNIFLCGSSAGGDLVLAAAQHSDLRQKVKGVLALYPLCDFVPTASEKMATRPDPDIPDFLGNNYDNVAKLYLDENSNPSMDDIRLSPTNFMARQDLPEHVLLIGCEHDMLCKEAAVMAGKLAEGKERIEKDSGWRAEGVEWYFVKGQKHAFDHFPAKDPAEERARIEVRDGVYEMMGNWVRGVVGSV